MFQRYLLMIVAVAAERPGIAFPRRAWERGVRHSIWCVLLALLSLVATISAFAETAGKPPPDIPPVLLTVGHRKLCLINVGDTFPDFRLPRLGGEITELKNLYGRNATILLFWNPDRWMARAALTDFTMLAKELDTSKVSMVGIAVGQPAGQVQAKLNQAQAMFPQLLDTGGTAFAQIGTSALPRVYVLDAHGNIVWFDIEYSEATRRELRQTLDVLTMTKVSNGQ